MAKPCIILVHGAYHQPSHWDLLVELLQSAGYSTFAPKLPSSGASPLPGVFDADVSSVKQAVLDATAKGATSVIPVFHSYGGIPGFEALASLTPEQKLAISRVICISAFVLPKGDSVVGVQESSERTYVRVEGLTATVPDPIPFFYNDVEPSLAESAAAALLPHAVEAFTTATQYDGSAEFPVTYVVCNDDRALSVAAQYKFIEVCRSREGRKGGREAVDAVVLKSGHSPMLSMPGECAKIIVESVGGVYPAKTW